MSNIKINFDMNAGWKRMRQSLDPARVKAVLERNLLRATKLNSRLVTRAIRGNIKSGKYEGNAQLTIIIKGSAKGLVDSGEMWRAVTHKIIDPYNAFIGVLRQTHGNKNLPLVNIAEFLHDGGVIKVTDKMRDMFDMLSKVSMGMMDPNRLDGRAREIWEASGGERIYPIGDATQFIRVKGRPFIRDAFEDPSIIAQVRKNWEQAVQATFKV